MNTSHSSAVDADVPASHPSVSQLRQAYARFKEGTRLIDEAYSLLGRTRSQESFDAGYITYLEGHILESDSDVVVEDLRTGYFLLCNR